jgi:hypothetical protein
MGEDSADLDNAARQIFGAQKEVYRCMKKAYYSQDGKGKVDESAFHQGNENLKFIERIVGENLDGFVDQINPSSLMEKMLAAGVSYEAAAIAISQINITRAGMKVKKTVETGMEIAEGAGEGELLGEIAIAVGIVVAAVAFAFFVHELYNWLNSSDSPPPPSVVKHYEDRFRGKAGSGYQPFQGRMIPHSL